MIREGVINKSRKQAEFTKRIEPVEREQFIKEFIARCNLDLLVPFIQIRHDRNYREIKYTLSFPLSDERKGVTHNSRKSSALIKSMGLKAREQYIKHFIADPHADLLIPHIRIEPDENYREIKYTIQLSLI